MSVTVRQPAARRCGKHVGQRSALSLTSATTHSPRSAKEAWACCGGPTHRKHGKVADRLGTLLLHLSAAVMTRKQGKFTLYRCCRRPVLKDDDRRMILEGAESPTLVSRQRLQNNSMKFMDDHIYERILKEEWPNKKKGMSLTRGPHIPWREVARQGRI